MEPTSDASAGADVSLVMRNGRVAVLRFDGRQIHDSTSKNIEELRHVLTREWLWHYFLRLKFSSANSGVELRVVPVEVKGVDERGRVTEVATARGEPDRTPEGHPILRGGENWMFEVRNLGDVPMHFCIGSLDAGGSVTPLFPHPDLRSGADHMTVPPDGAWHRVPLPYVMQATEPYGVEVLKVFASAGRVNIFNALLTNESATNSRGGARWADDSLTRGDLRAAEVIIETRPPQPAGDAANERFVEQQRNFIRRHAATLDASQSKVGDVYHAFNLAMNHYRDLITSRRIVLKHYEGPTLSGLRWRLEKSYPPGTTILFYVYEEGAETFDAWLLNQGGVVARAPGLPRAKVESAVADLGRSLAGEEQGAEAVASQSRARMVGGEGRARLMPEQAAAEVSSLLLPREFTPELERTKHLIVVPALGIGTVPFALLRPFADGTHLIDKMTISVAPSLTDIEYPADKWDGDFRNPLVVGDPISTRGEDAAFARLKWAKDEAEKVSAMLRARPLLGADATKEAVLARAGRADLLYFATHGVADDTDPLTRGYLFLAGTPEAPGRWTAKEIQSTPLRARLAVLSACQTGLGMSHRGGVIGLSRGFQLAGVPRVVMSLWNVEDRGTAELMRTFVSHLRTNTPAAALRLAVLEAKNERRERARVWAAFALFGTPL